jgi:hypothetical protein
MRSAANAVAFAAIDDDEQIYRNRACVADRGVDDGIGEMTREEIEFFFLEGWRN